MSLHAQPDFYVLMDAIGALIWELQVPVHILQSQMKVIPLSKALGSFHDQERYDSPIPQMKKWMLSQKRHKYSTLLKQIRERFPLWNIDETLVVEIIRTLELHCDVQEGIKSLNRNQGDLMLRHAYTLAHNFCCRLALRSLYRQASRRGSKFCSLIQPRSGLVENNITFGLFMESDTPVHVHINYEAVDLTGAGSATLRNHELCARIIVNTRKRENDVLLSKNAKDSIKAIAIKIKPGQPNCQGLIGTAKRIASGHILSMMHDNLLGHLPWFLTPGRH